MKANDTNENQWLSGEVGSIQAMTAMFIELDNCGLLPSDMRLALVKHADALLDVLPGHIKDTANLLAQAHAENAGVDSSTTSSIGWTIGFMADTIIGLQFLARLERDRQEYPEIHAAIRKAFGTNIKLASNRGTLGDTKH
jgi:hypothetical protein